jgi:hypothetical protein
MSTNDDQYQPEDVDRQDGVAVMARFAFGGREFTFRRGIDGKPVLTGMVDGFSRLSPIDRKNIRRRVRAIFAEYRKGP